MPTAATFGGGPPGPGREGRPAEVLRRPGVAVAQGLAAKEGPGRVGGGVRGGNACDGVCVMHTSGALGPGNSMEFGEGRQN